MSPANRNADAVLEDLQRERGHPESAEHDFVRVLWAARRRIADPALSRVGELCTGNRGQIRRFCTEPGQALVAAACRYGRSQDGPVITGNYCLRHRRARWTKMSAVTSTVSGRTCMNRLYACSCSADGNSRLPCPSRHRSQGQSEPADPRRSSPCRRLLRDTPAGIARMLPPSPRSSVRDQTCRAS